MASMGALLEKILPLAVPLAGLMTVSSSAWAITEGVLYNFCANRGTPVCSDGAGPSAGLFMDSGGNLYGTAANGGATGNGVAFRLGKPADPADAWSYLVLHSFAGAPGDGATPLAALFGYVDNGLKLYGTTYAGGAKNTGTVFEIDISGVGLPEGGTLQSVLGGDGANPAACLSEDARLDYLYGAAINGGLYTKGAVFKVAEETGKLTPVHHFGGVVKGRRDGANPFAGLVLDYKGNFFGTTNLGGGLVNGPGVGDGVVYEITANGDYLVVHEFGGVDSRGVSDGANPQADLAVDNQRRLYGTTLNGGAYNHGTVFRLSPPSSANGSWTQTILHSFEASWDGAGPVAGVILDGAGDLYGVASGGNGGSGVVFKISPPGPSGCDHPTPPDPWCEDILWAFPGARNDGMLPRARLIADGSGNLYGTTFGGGAWGQGVVYLLTGTGFVPAAQ